MQTFKEMWDNNAGRHSRSNIKKSARGRFEGSERFFKHCWKLLLQNSEEPFNEQDLDEKLEQIASACVNNQKSSFYMYGE